MLLESESLADASKVPVSGIGRPKASNTFLPMEESEEVRSYMVASSCVSVSVIVLIVFFVV